MGVRRKARELAVQALYTADLLGEWERDLEQLLPWGIESAESLPFARRLLAGVLERRAEIDRRIESSSSHWSLDRMNVVDRNILRLATFELLCCDDIPAKVSINEALELAKTFADREAVSFLNGILDRVARSLPGRETPAERRS